MKFDCPFYHHVPKDIAANLKWRARMHRKVMDDPSFADVIWDACARDPLFYINGWGFTYDPRRRPFSKLPFITYTAFQDEAILDMIAAIGNYDILIEKSRDMGASWLCLMAIEHQWHFRRHQSFLLVSRTEDYVDKADNPKSLFWKLDFFIDNLPAWLQPPGYDKTQHRRKLHISNPFTGSVIDGESTTGDVARGDRRTAILLDEFAAVEQGHGVLSATRDATNCRLFNSTPKGTGNAYYDIAQTGIRKLRLHWSAHPLKSKGLYDTNDDGTLKVLDQEGYLEGYEPILDGKLRSPWYDNECARAASAQEIAQELDIDYQGSGYQFFRDDAIREAIGKHARPPIYISELEHDATTADPIRFTEQDRGHFRVWCLLDCDFRPPNDRRYVIGADVSAGTGSSNSALCVWDQTTAEKVAEYANPYIRPEAFAIQAAAIGRWFNKALIIWESQGPGRQFGSRLIELEYGNIYYRKQEEAISKKTSDIPGWASTKEGKLVVLGDYRAAIEKGNAINRSKEALEETLEYVFMPDGSAEHARSSNKVDPTGAKKNHGDRVMADALAWKVIGERHRIPVQEKPEVPIGCLAWRNKQRELAKQKVGTELGAGWR